MVLLLLVGCMRFDAKLDVLDMGRCEGGFVVECCEEGRRLELVCVLSLEMD